MCLHLICLACTAAALVPVDERQATAALQHHVSLCGIHAADEDQTADVEAALTANMPSKRALLVAVMTT